MEEKYSEKGGMSSGPERLSLHAFQIDRVWRVSSRLCCCWNNR